MRWALHLSREAVQALYKIPRQLLPEVRAALKSLEENPTPPYMQVDREDPSQYWIAVPGDCVIRYEIIDEAHIVRVIDIE